MRYVKQLLGILVLVAFSFQAGAQSSFVPSGGEASQVLSCFYECKAGPVVGGVQTFQEITTLMVANHGSTSEHGDLVFLDGHGSAVAVSSIDLSPLDLDEVNVCHTLHTNAGIQPPSAGLVQIAVSNPALGGPPGIVAWVKNLGGRFFVDVTEPFDGRVDSIAKTECKAAPVPDLTDSTFVLNVAAAAPRVNAILVEDTAEAVTCMSGFVTALGQVGLEGVVVQAFDGTGPVGVPDTSDSQGAYCLKGIPENILVDIRAVDFSTTPFSECLPGDSIPPYSTGSAGGSCEEETCAPGPRIDCSAPA